MPCDKTASEPTHIPTKLTYKNKIIYPKTTRQILRIFKNAKMALQEKKKGRKARTIQNLLYLCGRVVAKKNQYWLTKFLFATQHKFKNVLNPQRFLFNRL